MSNTAWPNSCARAKNSWPITASPAVTIAAAVSFGMMFQISTRYS